MNNKKQLNRFIFVIIIVLSALIFATSSKQNKKEPEITFELFHDGTGYYSYEGNALYFEWESLSSSDGKRIQLKGITFDGYIQIKGKKVIGM